MWDLIKIFQYLNGSLQLIFFSCKVSHELWLTFKTFQAGDAMHISEIAFCYNLAICHWNVVMRKQSINYWVKSELDIPEHTYSSCLNMFFKPLKVMTNILDPLNMKAGFKPTGSQFLGLPFFCFPSAPQNPVVFHFLLALLFWLVFVLFSRLLLLFLQGWRGRRKGNKDECKEHKAGKKYWEEEMLERKWERQHEKNEGKKERKQRHRITRK